MEGSGYSMWIWIGKSGSNLSFIKVCVVIVIIYSSTWDKIRKGLFFTALALGGFLYGISNAPAMNRSRSNNTRGESMRCLHKKHVEI